MVRDIRRIPMGQPLNRRNRRAKAKGATQTVDGLYSESGQKVRDEDKIDLSDKDQHGDTPRFFAGSKSFFDYTKYGTLVLEIVKAYDAGDTILMAALIKDAAEFTGGKSETNLVERLAEHDIHLNPVTKEFYGRNKRIPIREMAEKPVAHGGILADLIVNRVSSLQKNVKMSTGHADKAISNIARLLKGCPRYVMDPKSYNLIGQIADKTPVGGFRGVEAPSGLFWTEFPRNSEGTTVGLLWLGDWGGESKRGEWSHDQDEINQLMEHSDRVMGSLVIVFRYPDDTIMVKSINTRIGESWYPGEAMLEYIDSINDDELDELAFEIESVTKVFWSFCMLITSPKIHKQEPVSFERLNIKRERRGKPPLLSYSRVKLSVDGPVTHGRATAVGTRATGEPSSGKRQHFVSAFTRIRLGRLEMVKCHFRGNPELGIVHSVKKVTAE